jgi:16S rRNA (cytosine967-C5)-methyltransferase
MTQGTPPDNTKTGGRAGGAQGRARGHSLRDARPNTVAPIRRPPGYAPRAASVRAIAGVLHEGRSFDDALERAFAANGGATMEPRDRAFTHLLVVTVLRRKGELDAVVSTFIDKSLPAKQGLVWPILLCGAAQLLCLETPPHAAISLAVDQARADTGARRFDRLVNAACGG